MELNFGDDLLGCGDSTAILSLPEQERAFVAPRFAAQFDHELTQQWKLYDPIGKMHLVSYERNSGKPFLSQGLLEIRKYYSLEGLNWCLLNYKGGSNFDLFIYNEGIDEVCYLPPTPPPVITLPPPAIGVANHTESHFKDIQRPQERDWNSYPCFFSCRLSRNQSITSQMNLPAHVYDHLHQGQLYTWILRGPTGKEVRCKILGVPEQRAYARIGKGWRAFCKLHALKEGDSLTFFFTSEEVGVIDVLIHDDTQ